MSRRLLKRWRTFLQHRSEIVGINRRNVELVYAHNERRHYPLADDKLLGKERLRAADVPVPETVAVCDGLFAVAGFINRLSAEEQFVVKPANGSGGSGIVVVGERLSAGRWQGAGGLVVEADGLRQHVANILFGTYSNQLEDRAFVERRIVPHVLFDRLWPDGLCDLRVITLRGEPVMSMVRVPTRRSRGRANLHQGGIGLAVDLARGRTFRAYSRGTTLTHHPESGQALLGLELPDWPRILAVARLAAGAVPLGYLGIDIVVDRARGPLVLEINARPGLEIQNVNGRGLWPAVARRVA